MPQVRITKLIVFRGEEAIMSQETGRETEFHHVSNLLQCWVEACHSLQSQFQPIFVLFA